MNRRTVSLATLFAAGAFVAAATPATTTVRTSADTLLTQKGCGADKDKAQASCSADKKAAADKAKKDASCSAEKKAAADKAKKDASCSADKGKKQASCSADKGKKDAACGKGSCGSAK